MPVRRSLCWIRRDLRLTDHAALSLATQESDQVAVVFVFDRLILDQLQDKDDKRLTFIHDSLREVDEKLRMLGSRLIVLDGNPAELIPWLAEQLEVESVYVNGDVEPYALERDAKVRQALREEGIQSKFVKDHVVFARREILNGSGEPFKVFTPYSKAWKAKLTDDDIREHRVDQSKFWAADSLPAGTEHPSIEELGFERSELWLEAGESAARERLDRFAPGIDAYGDTRDLFGIEGTSGLSVHLRHGTISIRECVREAVRAQDPKEKWLNELIWREFYQMILGEFPHVVGGSFKPECDAITWPGSKEHFKAWCMGQTGYPVVDAAMRCLVQTGWMHNRLRMITAMFLTKDLLVDWREGEEFFARYLLDFDLASNNGGWQWSASTGVDAQPYFRIFNPILQSKKFDPSGEFIRKWCPELSELDSEAIHWPHPGAPDGYPDPIVDHKVQSALAQALFKN